MSKEKLSTREQRELNEAKRRSIEEAKIPSLEFEKLSQYVELMSLLENGHWFGAETCVQINHDDRAEELEKMMTEAREHFNVHYAEMTAKNNIT